MPAFLSQPLRHSGVIPGAALGGMRSPKPASDSHQGGTMCVVDLPDVILFTIKGLDVITTAGLKENSTVTLLVRIDVEVDFSYSLKKGIDTVVLVSKFLIIEAKMVHEDGGYLLQLVLGEGLLQRQLLGNTPSKSSSPLEGCKCPPCFWVCLCQHLLHETLPEPTEIPKEPSLMWPCIDSPSSVSQHWQLASGGPCSHISVRLRPVCGH